MADTIKQHLQGNRPNVTKKVSFISTNQPPKRKLSSLQKIIFITILINVLCVITVVLLRNLLPPQVPLFYGSAEGETQLVPTLGLTLPSVISLCIVTVNALLSLLTKNQFFKQILIFAGLATTLLSVITTVKIIFLVGNI